MTAGFIAVDTETTGLMWQHFDRPFIVSMTKEDGTNLFWRAEVDPFTREPKWKENALEEIRKITEDTSLCKVFHNAPFDIHMLGSIGIDVKGDFIDTIVFTHLCNNGFPSYGLKPLAKTLFKVSTDDEADLKQDVRTKRRVGKKKGWKLGPVVETDYWMAEPELVKKYACLDTDRTMELLNWCICELKNNPEVEDLLLMEMECMKALIRSEDRGIQIDFKKAKELEAYYEGIILKEESIKSVLGYKTLNTRSPKQMMEVFYNELKADIVYATSKDKDGQRQKKRTANNKALEVWSRKYPLAKAIMNINSAKGELTKFVKPLQELADGNGILHPNYRQCGAVTGRLSCTNPNLQNISNVSTTAGGVDKRARALFVPREGHVLYFPDYSQVEVWIAGFASEDPIMCKYLASGGDMHDDFNVQFFGHKEDFELNRGKYRKKIKTLTFATLYGAGGAQLAGMGLGLNQAEGNAFIAMFFEKYAGLDLYKKALMQVVYDYGYIEDPFGRRYYIHQEWAFKSLNYMIQGSASGVMKRAIVNVDKMLKFWPGCRLLLTIHDELCVEAPLQYHSTKLMRNVIEAMQGNLHTYFNMPRPFDVGMAMTRTSWADKEEIEL
jgi:DNA polymerase-1